MTQPYPESLQNEEFYSTWFDKGITKVMFVCTQCANAKTLEEHCGQDSTQCDCQHRVKK